MRVFVYLGWFSLLSICIFPPIVQTITLIREEYDQLYSLWNSTNGPNWVYDYSVDEWNNAEPWNFTDFEKKNPCQQLWVGILANTFSSDCRIFTLNMSVGNIRNMTGPMPSSLNMSGLYFLVISEHGLTGQVPLLTNSPSLQIANFSYNNLTGRIPDTWYNMSILSLLYLSNNQLTGNLPPSLYTLEYLQYFSVYNNQLEGTISEDIANLQMLHSFNLGRNRFQGTVPKCIQHLINLEQLLLESNRFEGPLPDELPASLTSFRGSLNQFTGTVPNEAFCQCSNLTVLNFYNNKLHGTLSSCLSNLKALTIMQAQSNLLTGSLSGVFNPELQTKLAYIDISDNRFRGNFPAEIFRLPSLRSIAASMNCFEDRLPDTMCDLGNQSPLQIISMDGLQASPACLSYFWDPLHISVGYVAKLMQGSIPSCIWTLPNISVIHLAGNGFSGTLPRHLPSLPASLVNVALTHNEITGPIPQAFQNHPFHNLDLSYNKIKGSLMSSSFGHMPFLNVTSSLQANGAALILEVNRLSGDTPTSLKDVSDVNILSGNLFQCKTSTDLPHHDPAQTTYFCGSSQLDSAMYVFAFLSLLPFIGLLIICGWRYLPYFCHSDNSISNSSSLAEQKKSNITNISYWWYPHFDAQSASSSLSCFEYEPLLVKKMRQSLSYVLRYTWAVQACMLRAAGQQPFFHTTRVSGSMSERASWLRSFTLSTSSHQVDAATIPSSGFPASYSFAELSSQRAEGKRLIRKYVHLFQYLAALTLIRRLAWFIALYSITVCLPIYMYIYSSGSQDYSIYDNRYSWATTSAFLTGQNPAVAMVVVWTVLLWIFLYAIIRHYKMHTWVQQTQLAKLVGRASILGTNLAQGKMPSSTDIRESLLGNWHRPSSSSLSTIVSPHQASSPATAPMIMTAQEYAQYQAKANITVSSNKQQSYNKKKTQQPQKGNLVDEESKEPLLLSPEPSHQRPSDLTEQTLLAGRDDIEEEDDEDDGSKIFPDDPDLNPSNEERYFLLKYALTFLVIFTLNLGVSISINAAYLLLQNASNVSSDSKIFIQVLMAGFKIFWNMIPIRLMVSKLPYNKNTAKLHTTLLLTNTVLAPCIATAFTDSSCFSDFFFGANTICSAYYLDLCADTYQQYLDNGAKFITACSNYQEMEFVTEFTPTFIYYYTCGSKLLMAYIPVYIYTYTILLVMAPIAYTILASLNTKAWPTWVLALIDGALRPQDRGEIKFHHLCRGSAIQAILAQHLVVLLTFGMNSPILALVMALSISVDCFMRQLIFIRYIKYNQASCPLSVAYGRQLDNKYSCWIKMQKKPGSNNQGNNNKSRVSNNSKEEDLAVLSTFSDEEGVGEEARIAENVQKGSNRVEVDTEEDWWNRDSMTLLLGEQMSKKRRRRSATSNEGRVSDGNEEDCEDNEASLKKQQQEEQKLREEEAEKMEELTNSLHWSWLGMRNTMWLSFYWAMVFYAFILFDLAGDQYGWKNALWVVISLLCLLIATRVLFLDGMIFVHAVFRGKKHFMAQRTSSVNSSNW